MSDIVVTQLAGVGQRSAVDLEGMLRSGGARAKGPRGQGVRTMGRWCG